YRRVPASLRRVRQPPMMAFMIVPALVATAPPIMAPAICFGAVSAPPFHFSQANLPPPNMIAVTPESRTNQVRYRVIWVILSDSGGASGVGLPTWASVV